MQLRPRQREFVGRCLGALNREGNTLGIAPTGAGKTVMLSACAKEMPLPILVLQHRVELVDQNHRTFTKVATKIPTSFWTAGPNNKRFHPDGATFGMVQSVVNALDTMPRLGSIVVDEAHHSTANSYLQIINAAQKANPRLKLLGVTATPARGDKRTLRAVYSNVADAISVRELIATGHLVKPRTFVIDIGVREDLQQVRTLASDYDMDAVAEIMDSRVLNDKVVEEWKKVAGDRRTVVFCANVAHAKHVTDAFLAAGVSAGFVTGDMPAKAREAVLEIFDRGEIQVICNVAVLTEGWDCQPVSCVVLLRPSSHRSTMIQMIGRGLRKLDPERYPGIAKDDCLVLDFGTSVLQHGSIEADKTFGQGDVRNCPSCEAVVPDALYECPLCGASLKQHAPSAGTDPQKKEKAEKDTLGDFALTEVDLLAQSPYRWEELWNGVVMIATAFDAWAAMVSFGGRWVAVGGSKGQPIKLLACEADRLIALATADDFLRETGDPDAAAKNKRWLSSPPSEKQLQALGITSPMQAVGMTRYRAACLLTWRWSESAIKKRVMDAVQNQAGAQAQAAAAAVRAHHAAVA